MYQVRDTKTDEVVGVSVRADRYGIQISPDGLAPYFILEIKGGVPNIYIFDEIDSDEPTRVFDFRNGVIALRDYVPTEMPVPVVVEAGGTDEIPF